MSTTDTLVGILKAAGVSRVWGINQVPDLPDYPYAVVAAMKIAPQVRTLDGSGDPLGRFVVQIFGRTSGSVEGLADITFATFDGQVLPLPDSPVCWQEVTSGVYRDPDDNGVLTVTHTYRY